MVNGENATINDEIIRILRRTTKYINRNEETRVKTKW